MRSESRQGKLLDEAAALAAQLDAAQQRLLAMVRRLDAQEVAAAYGLASCEALLGWRIGLAHADARELVRVARALGELPLIDAAMERGELSYSKVRMMTRVANDTVEEALVLVAKQATAGQLRRICAAVRHEAREGDGAAPERWVRLRKLRNGLAHLTAQLLPDEAALVMAAVEAGRQDEAPADSDREPATLGVTADHTTVPLDDNDAPAPRPTRADGLVRMAEGFLAATPAGRSGGDRSQLFIHLKDDALREGITAAVLQDGTAISPEALRRIACDASLVPVSVDRDGRPLDVGRRQRTVPPAIRRALRVRDPMCRFPGCTNSRFVDAHHIEHWAHGGATSLENLVVLCHAHHRMVHEDGYAVRRDADGELHFTLPGGRRLAARPPPSEVPPGKAWQIDHLRDIGMLVIESDANFVWWDGTPAKINAAIGCVRPPSVFWSAL